MIVVVVLGLLPAMGLAAAPAGDVALGRKIAELNCSACHAVGRDGSSPHPRAPRFRELGAASPVVRFEDAFRGGRLGGHDGMPEFRLEPKEQASLIAYLRSLQERRRGAT